MLTKIKEKGLVKHMCRYTKTDWLWSSIVFLIVLVIAATNLTLGVPDWGDDFAAYISEGIAIADNQFKEQIKMNYVLHPSPLPEEANEEEIVYVWGYPLLLAAVYKIVGFDRIEYSTIIWYKMPLLLGIALLGGVLVLFYRRRFSLTASVLLSLLMCMSNDLFLALNKLYGDLTFLFFSMLTLLLLEAFCDIHDSKKRAILIGFLYGIVMWFTHEIRLNGLTVCLTAFSGHAIYLMKNRKMVKVRSLWVHAFPYIILLLMTTATEFLWLAPATQNLSDLGKATMYKVENNSSAYWRMILEFFESLIGTRLYGLYIILLAVAVIGIICKGITDNLHLTILIIGTFIVLIMLPYRQGVRYIFNILPLIILYVGYGFHWIWKKVKSKNILPANLIDSYGKIAGIVLSIYILAIPLFNQTKAGIENISHFKTVAEEDVYSPDAIDMYNYIRNNVPDDNTIAFGKPRALYLNTERLAFRPGYNGHKISDADYYLEYQIHDGEFLPEKIEANKTSMDLIYENDSFKLYSVREKRQ